MAKQEYLERQLEFSFIKETEKKSPGRQFALKNMFGLMTYTSFGLGIGTLIGECLDPNHISYFREISSGWGGFYTGGFYILLESRSRYQKNLAKNFQAKLNFSKGSPNVSCGNFYKGRFIGEIMELLEAQNKGFFRVYGV